MKAKMKILERILLPGILPEKASFEMGIAINDIRKKLTITQDEVTLTKLTTLPTGGMQWDAAKDRGIEIEFTDAETEIIRGSFEKASKEQSLPTDPAIIKLYKEFVINEKIKPIKK